MNSLKMIAAVASIAVTFAGSASAISVSTSASTTFHTVVVDNINIFYREAGPKDAPTLLLLHGYPSSSRMFDTLIPLLADKYHLIAPDYPGFGHSDAPDPASFAYTFDHIAQIVDKFTDVLGVKSYVLYQQDYGGPIGFRLALAHPERVKAVIVQNAVAHDDGLGPLWDARKAYWKDRAAHEATLIPNFVSLEVAKQRHVGSSPNRERYNPDTWLDEFAMLSRPGQTKIQADLFYDYQTNVASYPKWQQWMREHKPNMLVLWGKYDPSFALPEAAAYQRDVPGAEVHVLEAGHFALDEANDEIAAYIRDFLNRNGL